MLRTKYGLKEHLSNSIARSQWSHLWLSLSKMWPLLCENLAWSVGSGTSICCWKNSWILGIRSLLSFVPAHVNMDMESTLKYMVMHDRYWNIDIFRGWLPEELIQHIISIPPPIPIRE